MSKIHSIVLVVLLGFSLFANKALGQMAVPSPTAANLGLYGEIPVSHYTGTPDISIPLYEIKGKHVRVPIALTYHPSGIRPEIHPGPTGLGWSLQAGGVITRTVRGVGADEWDNGGIESVIQGYLGFSGSERMTDDRWKQEIRDNCGGNSMCCQEIVRSSMPYSDLEPDEFSFSFPGLSGKFYFDHYGEIQVQCDRPVKVFFDSLFIQPRELRLDYPIPDHCSGLFQRSIKGFTIVDEFGTQYSFGGEQATEFSDPISYGSRACPYPLGYSFQATSWFLTKIVSADGVDVIDFTYERGPFVTQLSYFANYYYESSVHQRPWNSTYVRSGTIICPVYLTKIQRLNGEVLNFSLSRSKDLSYTAKDYNLIFQEDDEYNYGLLTMVRSIPRLREDRYPDSRYDHIQWLKLDTITINNGHDDLLKKINFQYHEKPNERLFLDGLVIQGGNMENQVRYAFTYKDRDKLAAFPYLSCITDHWGFLNGKKHINNGFAVAQRTPDMNYATSGVLSAIRYPTGGTAQFTYEMHDYARVVDSKKRDHLNTQTGVAGGLRIRKIETVSGHGQPVTREYFYKKSPGATASSGVLNAIPTYASRITVIDTEGKPLEVTHYRSYPAIPLTTENDGRYIGYTDVCEQVSDGSGGYTQYTYTNHDNGYHDVQPLDRWNRDSFSTDPHNSRFFERGKLLQQQHYNQQQQLVWEQRTEWHRYGPQGEENPRAFYFEGIQLGYGYCSSAAYLHYCYKFLPWRKEEITYNLNQSLPFAKTTDYMYNSDHLPLSETTTDSEGRNIVTRYRYPEDMLNGRVADRSAYRWLFDRHIHRPVEQIQYRDGKVVSANFTEYGLFNDKAYPTTDWALETVQPVADYDTLSQDSRLATQVIYERYDEYGNVLQQRGVDGITISSLWGYSGRYKLAEAVGATYDQVATALGGQDVADRITNTPMPSSSDWTLFNSLRSEANLKDARVTTYTYKPQIGITSETDPNGVITYFEYDDLGRLKRVRDYEGNVLKEHEYRYYNND